MSGREHDEESLRAAFLTGHAQEESATGCPDDGEIWSASRGELPPERTKELLNHSLTCADCKQSWLAAAALAAEGGLDEDATAGSRVTDPSPAARSDRIKVAPIMPFPVRHRTLLTAVAAIAATLFVMLVLTNVLNRNEILEGVPSLTAGTRTILWRVGEPDPLATGDSLRVGDRIYMTVESEEPLHVYVINTDETGASAVLFPVEGAQWSNPLPAGMIHRLPGDTDSPYDSWEVSSAGGRESFTVIASLEPLERLEAVLARLDAAVPEEQLLRGGDTGRTSSETDPAEAMAALGRVLGELRTESSAQSVLVREIVLENPGSPES